MSLQGNIGRSQAAREILDFVDVEMVRLYEMGWWDRFRFGAKRRIEALREVEVKARRIKEEADSGY